MILYFQIKEYLNFIVEVENLIVQQFSLVIVILKILIEL